MSEDDSSAVPDFAAPPAFVKARLEVDTLDVFAAEIAAGRRVEIDPGTIRVPLVEVDWRDAPFWYQEALEVAPARPVVT